LRSSCPPPSPSQVNSRKRSATTCWGQLTGQFTQSCNYADTLIICLTDHVLCV
jgi:hypothetical protein